MVCRQKAQILPPNPPSKGKALAEALASLGNCSLMVLLGFRERALRVLGAAREMVNGFSVVRRGGACSSPGLISTCFQGAASLPCWK